MPVEKDEESTRERSLGQRLRWRCGLLGGSLARIVYISGVVGGALPFATPAYAAAEDISGDMARASQTLAEAERLLAEDPRRAIVLYERGLELLPEGPGYAPTRVDVLLTIVDAYGAAFADDGDIQQLYRARDLLDRYLGPLDILDEQGRAAAEEQRGNLLDRIAAVEARMRAEALVREAAEARDRGRRLTYAGIGALAGTIVSLSVMGLGISGGSKADDDIGGLLTSNQWEEPCAVGDGDCQAERRDALAPLIDRGNMSNTRVLGGAIVGGLLATAGMTLIVLGRKSVREAAAIKITPNSPGAGLSLGLAVRGRF